MQTNFLKNFFWAGFYLLTFVYPENAVFREDSIKSGVLAKRGTGLPKISLIPGRLNLWLR